MFFSWQRRALASFVSGKRNRRARPLLRARSRPGVEVLEARTLPSFSQPQIFDIPCATCKGTDASADRPLVTGDFNGDHIPDLATVNVDDGALVVLQGTRDGSGGAGFAPFSTIPLPEAKSVSRPVFLGGIAAGNFNGDGFDDLAVSDPLDETIKIFRGSASGMTLTQTLTTPPGTNIDNLNALAVGHFTGGSLPDIAALPSHEMTSYFILKNQGNGTFTLVAGSPLVDANGQAFPVYAYDPDLVVHDFTGDGKDDIALADVSTSTVDVLRGNGGGNGTSFFTGVSTTPTARFPHRLVAGPIDGDNNLDLAATSFGVVSILKGNGDGNFTRLADVNSPTQVQDIALGSFTTGGHTDLAISSQVGGIAVLKGDGTGGFAQPSATTFSAPLHGEPVEIAVADFTGSGRGDLASLNVALTDASGTSPVGYSASLYVNAPPTSPALTVSSSQVPDDTGAMVTLSASLDGGAAMPTGTVLFLDYNTGATLAQATVTNGQAVAAPIDLPAGDDTISTVYSGDDGFEPSVADPYTFTVTALVPPPPPAAGLIELQENGSDLPYNAGTGLYAASGTIQVGLAPSSGNPFVPLLQVDGSASFNPTTTTVHLEGTVSTNVTGTDTPLFHGVFEFNGGGGDTSLLQPDTSFANPFKLAGLDLLPTNLALTDGGVQLQGRLTLPPELGGADVQLTGQYAITLGPNGVSLGGTLSLPSVDLTLAGLGVHADHLSISYDSASNALKLQGRVTLGALFGATANFAGTNFIEVQGGNVTVVGDLTVKQINIVPNSWYVRNVKLHVNTATRSFEGQGTLFLPGGYGVFVDLGLVNGQLDAVQVGADGLNLAIPLVPFSYLQHLDGGVTGLSSGSPGFSGGVGFTYGPKVSFDLPAFLGGGQLQASLASLDLNATVDANHLDATGTVSVLEGLGGSGQGTVNVNWAAHTVHVTTDLSLLANTVNVTADFSSDANGDISFTGDGTVQLPEVNLGFLDIQPITLSTAHADLQYFNGADPSQDYITAYGTVNFPVIGDLRIGVRVFFDGHVDPIGVKDPVGQTFTIPAGTNQYLLTAAWQNAVGDVPLEVVAPDGTVYPEAAFDNTSIGVIGQLSGATSKTIGLLNPAPGDWTIRIPDETRLGQVQFHSFFPIAAPTLAITSTTASASGVTVGYDAGSSEANAKVTLYYDTDNTGFNGAPIATGLPGTTAGQSYVWNTAGVQAGTYYVYGKIDDGINPAVWVYSPTSVTIANQAPVLGAVADQTVNEGATVDVTASATDPNGDPIVYRLAAGAPAGAAIDPVSGELTWTPTAAQGPGVYPVTVRTTDNGTPALSDSKTIQITVDAVNHPPVFDVLHDASAPPGGTVQFTAHATDPDLPAQAIAYSLDAGAPAGAGIDPTTGVFHWAVPASQPWRVYDVTVRATDNGSPTLSVAQPLHITVGTVREATSPGTLQFDAATHHVAETGGSITVLVTRTGGDVGPVTVHYDVSGGTAVAGTNYTPTSGDLTFADGVTTPQPVTVAVLDDHVHGNGARTVNLTLTAVGGAVLGTPPTTTLTITDRAAAANLSVSQVAVPKPVNAGSNLTFTITAHNAGPDAATGVTLTDTLPQGGEATFVSATVPSGVTFTHSGNVVTFAVGNLASGADAIVTLTTRAVTAGTPSNKAVVAAAQADPDTTNNTNVLNFEIDPAPTPRADLSVSQTANLSKVTAGSTITFTITAHNAGPDAATGVTLTDTLPQGGEATFVSATAPAGVTFTQVGNVVTFTVGSLASGADATVTIVARAVTPGTPLNRAVVAADQVDPATANNSKSADFEIDALPAPPTPTPTSPSPSPSPIPPTPPQPPPTGKHKGKKHPKKKPTKHPKKPVHGHHR